jgi:chorismate mutase
MNFSDGVDLSKIRAELMRLEDTIIFSFIERSQFAQNNPIYSKGSVEGVPTDSSFLEYCLHELECAHSKMRRYTSPDEYPFTENLPSPVLPPLAFPNVLHPNTVNVNQQILKVYVEQIVPAICKEGNDGNYGSSATKDADCLQTLSRRIHFGTLFKTHFLGIP